MKILPVILTIVFTTLGQLVFKQGVERLEAFPSNDLISMIKFFFHALTNIWIIAGLVSALLAAFSWMAALSRFELSSVYPFQSINFILVPAFCILLFQESFNWYKAVGILVIVFGIIIFSKGM